MTGTLAVGRPGPASATFGADADVLSGFPSPAGTAVAFAEDRWDFRAVEGRAPNVPPCAWVAEWSSIANPVLRLAAKEVLFAKLHPDHPAVIEALGWRRAMAIRGIGPHLAVWRAWFAWLDDNDLHELCHVRPHHWEAYLVLRRRDGVSDQHLAVTVKRIRELYDYAPVLTEPSYPSRPWGRRTAWSVAGVRRSRENATQPIPEAIFAPLVSAALHLVEHAETIVAARDLHMDLLDHRCAPSGQGRGADPAAQREENDRRLQHLIDKHRGEPRPLPLSATRAGARLGRVNLGVIGLWAGLSPKALAAPHRRALLAQAAAELGVAPAPLTRRFQDGPNHEEAFGQV
ncbi:MAG: hypothetical protein ACRD0J_17485, partial [Acidimicrobiales bacterium]